MVSYCRLFPVSVADALAPRYTALPSDVRASYEDRANLLKGLVGEQKGAASSVGVKAAAGMIAVGLAGIALL